jgi:hypothetical protein
MKNLLLYLWQDITISFERFVVYFIYIMKINLPISINGLSFGLNFQKN